MSFLTLRNRLCFIFLGGLLAAAAPLHAQHDQGVAADFLQLDYVIELDNHTYINTVSSITVSKENEFLLLDAHRTEAYLVSASGALSDLPSSRVYTASAATELAYEQCGNETNFSPYKGEFAGPDRIIIYNQHDRPLLFDTEGNCLARLSYDAGGPVNRIYAEYETEAGDTAGREQEPVRGIWTHEADADNRHTLRYQSFRRVRSEERHIPLDDIRLPVMNRFQNGGGLFLHEASDNLFLVGASSADVYEIASGTEESEAGQHVKTHQPQYSLYRENPSDIPAGLPASRRINRIVQAIQSYGYVDQVYQLDADRLLLVYKRNPQQRPPELDDDGLPVETNRIPEENRAITLLMIFDMQERRFAEEALRLEGDEFISGAGNGRVFIARRSEEASLQRGIINPLIYVYKLNAAE